MGRHSQTAAIRSVPSSTRVLIKRIGLSFLPPSSTALSTSVASTEKCEASLSNSSRFFGSVAKSRIIWHSAASLRSFSNWVREIRPSANVNGV
jgi:hypothetical protein